MVTALHLLNQTHTMSYGNRMLMDRFCWEDLLLPGHNGFVNRSQCKVSVDERPRQRPEWVEKDIDHPEMVALCHQDHAGK